MITVETAIRAQFYDLDPMAVVWHGNYARYLEQARCALLDRIGYNYDAMQDSGYLWPVVDMRIKYVRPIRCFQDVIAAATLVEYQNRLKITYRIRDAASGEILTKGETVQVAVEATTGAFCLESPAALIDRLKDIL